MKTKFQLLFMVTFVSLISVVATAKEYNCTAGRRTLIYFQALDNGDKSLTLVFDKKQSAEVQDLAGKTVQLNFAQNRGNESWNYTVGKTLVDAHHKDYIHFEIGYLASRLNQGQLVGKFFMSPRSVEERPRFFNSMELLCH